MIFTHVDFLTFGDSDTPDDGPVDKPREVKGLEKPDDSVPLTFGKATQRMTISDYNSYRAKRIKTWILLQEEKIQSEADAAQKAQEVADAKAILAAASTDPNARLQQAKLAVLVDQFNEVRAKIGLDPIDISSMENAIATKIDEKVVSSIDPVPAISPVVIAIP